MSSVVKKFAQIKPEVKYLTTLSETKYLTNTQYEALVEQYGGRSVIVAPFADGLPEITETFQSSKLLKDLGRELYVNFLLPNKKVTRALILRQVQLVSGSTSNGVSPPPPDWMTGWVVTWAADPTGDYAVTVARSG